MRLLFLLTYSFKGSNAFIGTFSRQRAQYTVTVIDFLARRQRRTTTQAITNHPPNNSFHLEQCCKHNIRSYHARITNKCLSRESNDALDNTIHGMNNARNIMYDDDKAKQNRRERLHYHLNELGIDVDSLEDAALRSVTTTGKHVLMNTTFFIVCGIN